MQEGYQLNIDEKLKEAWSIERRFIHTRGIIRSLIWIVSLIITDLIVDLLIWKGIGDNRYGTGLMVINIGIISFVIYREWYRHLKPYNAVRTALQVESKNPKLSSILITYTELSATDSTSNTSEEIVQAIRERANERTESINFQEIVSWEQIYRVFAISAIIIIVFTLISINWKDQVGTLLQRLTGKNVKFFEIVSTPQYGILEDNDNGIITRITKNTKIFPNKNIIYVENNALPLEVFDNPNYVKVIKNNSNLQDADYVFLRSKEPFFLTDFKIPNGFITLGSYFPVAYLVIISLLAVSNGRANSSKPKPDNISTKS